MKRQRKSYTRKPKLEAASLVFDYPFYDFEFEGYDPAPTIKAVVAV